MKTNTKILSMGIILLISGVIAALLSFGPSSLLQYTFVTSSLSVGILGILIGRKTKGQVVRTTYYSGIGVILVAMSIAILIWGTSFTAMINLVGFFMLILGIVEFVFAIQILTIEDPIPWSVVGIKLALSATAAIGAASILTIVGFAGYMTMLFLGLLFIVVGLVFIRLSRLSGSAH